MPDYSKYNGKKVVVVRAVAGSTDAEEVEGTAQVANATGVLLKPKGQTKLELIDAANIEDIRFVEDEQKDLGVKTLKIVDYGQARNHLLERHGFTLPTVNAMTEKEAYELHGGIDHVAAELGHIHGDKTKTERVQAVEAASV
jgi:hypothetical protein